MKTPLPCHKIDSIRGRLTRLYGAERADILTERFISMVGRYGVGTVSVADAAASHEESPPPLWDENDVALITYGGTLREEGTPPLRTLKTFLDQRLRNIIRLVHILPFCPWSSDDGFSVIDFREIDPALGTWDDIDAIGRNFDLMFDLVLNHCSRESAWFRDFTLSLEPARHYFHEVDPATDLSAVVRPRTSPLLTPVSTRDGETHVWTTFSDDQVDLDWSNPDVLFEFLDILFLYLAHEMRVVRLDAIAFLWKKFGTSCLHLPETHEVVKLLRDAVEVVSPKTVLLTETNVPHKENISYFGQGDEAHMVYNFTLAPLLLHTLLKGNATALSTWARTLPELPPGQTFFNFTASHDGIGVRPVQGILSPEELDELVACVRSHGGLVSSRSLADGTESPYELNITYRDALSEPDDPELGLQRFLCSQAIALGLRGMPALYIHSLLGTGNDYEGVEESGIKRRINRHAWNASTLANQLDDETSVHARVFKKLTQWVRRRQGHFAFHPDAPMEVLATGQESFAFLRRSTDGSETLLCLHNVTPRPSRHALATLHPHLASTGTTRDILNSTSLKTGPQRTLALPAYGSAWIAVREHSL